MSSHNKNKGTMPVMTVGKYSGTPIDQLPVSYLRWMMMQDFPKLWLDIAKKKVEASAHSNDYISVSRHAVDMFSLRFWDRWVTAMHASIRNQEKPVGMGTFIAKLAQEAWDKGKDVSKHRHQDDGVVKELDGIRFVYGTSDTFPDYKDVVTVMGRD